jgi:RNA polymerase sigma-70 factor (ECF subfamily)
VETNLEAAEALGRLYAVLDRIDPTARVIFVLRFVEDVPVSDIADALGCSLATAKRRVSRISKRIATIAERDTTLVSFLAAATPPDTVEPRDG